MEYWLLIDYQDNDPWANFPAEFGFVRCSNENFAKSWAKIFVRNRSKYTFNKMTLFINYRDFLQCFRGNTVSRNCDEYEIWLDGDRKEEFKFTYREIHGSCTPKLAGGSTPSTSRRPTWEGDTKSIHREFDKNWCIWWYNLDPNLMILVWTRHFCVFSDCRFLIHIFLESIRFF